jgi:hypothetical protein
LVAEPRFAETGAIVVEDDVLIHHEFAELSEAALDNLPSGTTHCLLAYMLAPPDPELEWASREPSHRNLCSIRTGYMWRATATGSCPGLARHGHELIASFGVGDHSAAFALMEEAEVLESLRLIGRIQARE